MPLSLPQKKYGDSVNMVIANANLGKLVGEIVDIAFKSNWEASIEFVLQIQLIMTSA